MSGSGLKSLESLKEQEVRAFLEGYEASKFVKGFSRILKAPHLNDNDAY